MQTRNLIEERYSAVFRLCPEALVLVRASDGAILECNEAFAAQFGIACGAAAGRAAAELGIYPEARERQAFLERLRRPSFSEDWELAVRRSDGAARQLLFSSRLTRIGGEEVILSSCRDVTEQREQQRALAELQRTRAELENRMEERASSLRRSEERYRELVEDANSIILEMDRHGRITFFNEFAQRFFGYGEQEILGKSAIGTIVPARESGSEKDLARMVADLARYPGRFTHNENENLRKNGEHVWIAWDNRPILDAQGALSGVLCIGNDISELKRTERELIKAKEAAESADRLKSAFMASMSHELRTPLNSIIGFTGILLQGLAGPLNPEQTKQLGMVRNSANHLLSLISDVLDISKIEAGQLEIVNESFDPGKALDRVVQAVAPLAEKKSIGMVKEIDPGVGSISADKRRFEQVAMNLLGNAIKFTERGTVAVTCARREGHVVVSIRDTGIGIPPEEQGKLFKPFYQVESGLTRRHEGTGLGLSICKKLVELMGGAIYFKSQPGIGSTFTFELPISRG